MGHQCYFQNHRPYSGHQGGHTHRTKPESGSRQIAVPLSYCHPPWRASVKRAKPDGPIIGSGAEAFLKKGNKFLFRHNMKNAKALITNNGSLTGSFTDVNGTLISFDGLKGKDLDYALVNFEQSLVQDFIKSYEGKVGSDEMASIIQDVNDLFTSRVAKVFGNGAINDVMNEYFDGGKSFDFSNYDDRVLLGQKLVDKLHE